MDRSIPRGKRIAIRFHLLMCRFCRRYQRQLRFLRTLIRLHAAPPEQPPPGSAYALPHEARNRIKQKMARERGPETSR
jgi:hypothetical protein